VGSSRLSWEEASRIEATTPPYVMLSGWRIVMVAPRQIPIENIKVSSRGRRGRLDFKSNRNEGIE
jgi:hypothetical protein